MTLKDAPSIDPAEVEKFSAMAAEWWDPAGKFAPLHRFNPVRLHFIHDTLGRHFGRKDGTFSGLKLLDIGCGGGLVSEPMARAGFAVTGADASGKNIAAASLHGQQGGLSIDYRQTTAETLAEAGETFDVVLNLEVIEHVADLKSYLAASARLVAPGGIMIVASLNKTLKSLALAKIGAEYVLGWLPKGSHDWSRFVSPSKLRGLLEENGLTVRHLQGVAFDPIAWGWVLSGDTSVNYMVVALRA